MNIETKWGVELRNCPLGRVPGEGIVTVDVRLKWEDGPRETVDHETIQGAWRFSVSGCLWKRHDSPDCYAAGQIVDTVARLDTPNARELVRLWKAYHMNDMKAACAHMEEPPRSPHGQITSYPEPCPVTGYKYGEKWLTKIIPDNEVTAIRLLAANL